MAKLLYNKTEASQLTAEERQHIITLSSIAGAVAGGVTSQTSNQSNTTANTVQNAVLGGEIGKSAVENNHFGDDIHPSEDRRQTIEMLAIAMFKGDIKEAEKYYEEHKKEIHKLQLQEYVMLTFGKVLPQTATASTAIAGAFSGGSEVLGQLIENDWNISDIDSTKVLISAGVGAATKGMSVLGVSSVNAGVEVADSFRTGKDPIKEGSISFISTIAGGLAGKWVEKPLNDKLNPIWKIKYSEKTGHLPYGISESYTPSVIPSISGNVFDNIIGKGVEYNIDQHLKKGRGDEKNKIYLFLLCYFSFFLSLSVAGIILPFIIDLMAFFVFGEFSFNPLKIKYYLGMAIMAFPISIYYLWSVKR